MENINLADNFLPEFESEEAQLSWSIKDDLTADWALDKIREVEAEKRRMEMAINDKIGQLKDKLAQVAESSEREIGFFENALYQYFKTVKHKATKTQRKYSLPSGELVEKDQKAEFNRDNDTLLKWAAQANKKLYVKTKEEPIWSVIKDDVVVKDDKVYSTLNGDLVEGVTVVQRPAKFTVKY